MTESDRYAHDPAAFIDDHIPLSEKGQPWRLSPYQRRVLAIAFRWDAIGRLLFRLLIWSELKKSGKTFIAACLTLWWAFTNPETEIIVCANDLEQAQGRVFRTLVALLRHNPALAASAVVLTTEVRLSNGTLITPIASDYKGAAGSRHSLYVVDEPWGIMDERAERLIEELTPPPTEPNAWGLWATTAGILGESKMLEAQYRRGLTGERLDPEFEVYQADELVMFWSHTPRQPWQTPEYYAEQRRSLRPMTFDRLHRNEWRNAESIFITGELWDGNVDLTLRPLLPTQEVRLFGGVDIGPKHDATAVVWVHLKDGSVTLAHHHIWTPGGEALDLESTVEAHLREMHRLFRVDTIVCDPYQFHRSIMTLQREGLPIEEFPQTVANTVRMGQVLFELLKGRNLRLYPDADLRQQAMNTVAVESPRGFRIAKEKTSKKIDAVVALAMACVAAIDAGENAGLIWFLRAGMTPAEAAGRAPVATATEGVPAEMLAARALKAEQEEQARQQAVEERERREIWSRSESWRSWS